MLTIDSNSDLEEGYVPLIDIIKYRERLFYSKPVKREWFF